MSHLSSKKEMIADKMYRQSSTGGEGTKPKYDMQGKAKGKLSMKYDMEGKAKGKLSEKPTQANTKGSFKGGYHQEGQRGMQGGYKQANC